jgi:hypothetical protein
VHADDFDYWFDHGRELERGHDGRFLAVLRRRDDLLAPASPPPPPPPLGDALRPVDRCHRDAAVVDDDNRDHDHIRDHHDHGRNDDHHGDDHHDHGRNDDHHDADESAVSRSHHQRGVHNRRVTASESRVLCRPRWS